MRCAPGPPLDSALSTEASGGGVPNGRPGVLLLQPRRNLPASTQVLHTRAVHHLRWMVMGTEGCGHAWVQG